MMKVIAISGKAQHGKDTAAKFMKEALEAKGKKVLVVHFADLVKYVCSKYFNWNGEKDEKGRTLLQFIGTDVVRKQKPNFWVDFVRDILKMFYGQWDYVLIPDCRFPNEIDALISSGFFVVHVRIFRPDFDNGLTEEQKNHLSETALDDYQYGSTLTNEGTIDDFRVKIEKYIKMTQ